MATTSSSQSSCQTHRHQVVDHKTSVKKLKTSDHFWIMRSTKCARDCGGSSISHKSRKKLTPSDHFSKRRSTKCARDSTECSISHRKRKRTQGFGNSFLSIHSFQLIHVKFQVIHFNSFLSIRSF